MYLDPNNINPEEVEQSAADVMGEKITFPRAYFSECRADWKFMKDSGDMCLEPRICTLTISNFECRNCYAWVQPGTANSFVICAKPKTTITSSFLLSYPSFLDEGGRISCQSANRTRVSEVPCPHIHSNS